MHHANRITEVENKLTSVVHSVTDSEWKRVLLRGLRAEFAVTEGVIRATGKSQQK